MNLQCDRNLHITISVTSLSAYRKDKRFLQFLMRFLITKDLLVGSYPRIFINSSQTLQRSQVVRQHCLCTYIIIDSSINMHVLNAHEYM